MLENFFRILTTVEEIYWSYIGFAVVMASGVYLTARCKGFQFKILFSPKKTMRELRNASKDQVEGTNPFKLYFASIGGMIGLGNLVAVVTAIIIGGPGALFWMWIAVFFGMIIKYCEIYLGVYHRVKNKAGGYDGGPMYYLGEAFKGNILGKVLPIIICFLLCIYGIEIFQFVVIVDTLTDILDIHRLIVIGVLLAGTIYTGFGGVNRLANICTVLMPIFMILYISMCIWVIISNITELPVILKMVFTSAFKGMAPLGGFAGSTFLLAAQQGISRAVYSGDIAIGYDSIIQSETRAKSPESQARLAIFGILGDAIFSTMTIVTILVTGLLWNGEGLKTSEYISAALATSFPYIKYFIALFFFLAGWTTIIGYVVVGAKAAKFLSPKYGARGYLIFAVVTFLSFSYADQTKVYLIMSLSGGLCMLINLSGLLKLRKEIKFKNF